MCVCVLHIFTSAFPLRIRCVISCVCMPATLSFFSPLPIAFVVYNCIGCRRRILFSGEIYVRPELQSKSDFSLLFFFFFAFCTWLEITFLVSASVAPIFRMLPVARKTRAYATIFTDYSPNGAYQRKENTIGNGKLWKIVIRWQQRWPRSIAILIDIGFLESILVFFFFNSRACISYLIHGWPAAHPKWINAYGDCVCGWTRSSVRIDKYRGLSNGSIYTYITYFFFTILFHISVCKLSVIKLQRDFNQTRIGVIA